MNKSDEALDYFSVNSQLNTIMEYQYNYEGGSQYYDYYIEQINEMSTAAADMSNELREIVQKIGRELPWKDIEFYNEDDVDNSDISWFNTALAMIDDLDMIILLAGEEIYKDEIKEKDKRLKVIDRLTKSQIKSLLGLTFNYIHRYLKLKGAFDIIIAVIDELDYHQSAVKGRDGETMFNDAAWLA